MSITCKICNTTFEKIIPWQHLKTHGITSAEYKATHGPLYSPETLAKHSTKVPYNKGMSMSSDQKEKLRSKALERNKIWRDTNTHPIVGQTRSASTISKIKEKRQKQVISPESAKKAIQTKIKRGIAFNGFKGKTHSAESKKKISDASKKHNLVKSSTANSAILEKINELSLSLLNDISNTQLQLKCNKCDSEFTFTKQYFHASKFKTTLCPTCFPRTSKNSQGEKELYDFILALCPDAIGNFRTSYHCKEIDVFVPSLNIGFEYNGLYWHSEIVSLNNNKNPKSDFLKQKHFADNNIQLIQIFEDEWENKRAIVQSRIKNILNKSNKAIYARTCSIREISSKESSIFFNENHLMGNGRSNVRVGLFVNDELISAMSFTKSNISRKLNTWELNRFASKLNHNVVGGASKLFKWFVTHNNVSTVISYSDNRWSNGNLYSTIGFNKVSSGTPSYWYFLPNVNGRIHRYALRKSAADNQQLSEWENRVQQGYNRVWDSGHAKWQWSIEKGH